jgi:hypothetical protein
MFRRVLGAVGLTVAAVGFAASAVGASTPQAVVSPAGFTTPVKVIGGEFGTPAMVVDSTNAIDIAAAGRGGLWFITNRSGSWKHEKVLANPTNKSWTNPSIAIDSSDHVYIALERTQCDDCTPWGSDGVFLISDKGRAHGDFPAVADKIAGGAAGDASVKAVGGRIYVAYSSPCSCIPGDGRPLYLKTSTNGTSWTKSLVTHAGYNPQLRVTSNGHARVAYTRDQGLGYAVAATDTGSFSDGAIPHTDGFDSYPLLALDANGRARIVYESSKTGYQIRYERQTASSWGTSQNVAPLKSGYGFDLDTNGTPKVAQGTKTGVQLYALNGGTWTQSTIGSATHADGVVLRRAFNGKVAVAWDDENNGGIWVTRG